MLTLAALVVAPAAPAATEVGSNCQADRTQFNSTLVQLYNRPGAELPIAAPAAGVLTQWKVNLGAVGSLPLQLKVLEPGGYPNDFHVVAQSPVVAGSPGPNVIDSRLPVKPGYRFGLYSQDGQTPYCHTAFAQDTLGYALGDAKVTSTYTFPMETQAQVPVAVRIEPDGDGDGFGDETQDLCPQNATTQGPCPPVTLEANSRPGRGVVRVFIISDTKAPVRVSGTVKLGQRRKVMTLSGGTQIVLPGQVERFELTFPDKLKDRLEELSPERSLRLKITANTHANGQTSSDFLVAKLTGQA
jgi:hypothetical protein